MNKTEQKAFNWLILQGIKKDDIKFQKRESPDFILKDGRKFEIKAIYGNRIRFTKNQFNKFQDTDVNILVFENGTPIMNFPFSEINEQEINYQVNRNIRTIEVKRETWEKLKKIKTDFGYSTFDELLNNLLKFIPKISKRGSSK